MPAPLRRRTPISLQLLLSVGLAACSAEEPATGPSAAPVEAQAAATYAVLDLGTLGGRRSEANDINQAGVVVGWSEVTPDGFSRMRSAGRRGS